jgi:hypothetical protein
MAKFIINLKVLAGTLTCDIEIIILWYNILTRKTRKIIN